VSTRDGILRLLTHFAALRDRGLISAPKITKISSDALCMYTTPSAYFQRGIVFNLHLTPRVGCQFGKLKKFKVLFFSGPGRSQENYIKFSRLCYSECKIISREPPRKGRPMAVPGQPEIPVCRITTAQDGASGRGARTGSDGTPIRGVNVLWLRGPKGPPIRVTEVVSAGGPYTATSAT
jgi:hypothetical protein